ncbi:MAG TPA: 5-carboxymethyl-2-hydroxymuconate isomerase [Gammaproteobacteria bacterium]|nr:5-carboxymethyl-2-hydroxymuconate isomerase [Gammaproteobacteria bacterium]
MAHFIVEYSANLEGRIPFSDMFSDFHDYASGSGVFPLAGIRSRAIRCTDYRIADGRDDYGFVHMTVKMGSGRSLDVRRNAAKNLFDILCKHLNDITTSGYCQVSFELKELDPELKFNKNNIHELLNN